MNITDIQNITDIRNIVEHFNYESYVQHLKYQNIKPWTEMLIKYITTFSNKQQSCIASIILKKILAGSDQLSDQMFEKISHITNTLIKKYDIKISLAECMNEICNPFMFKLIHVAAQQKKNIFYENNVNKTPIFLSTIFTKLMESSKCNVVNNILANFDIILKYINIHTNMNVSDLSTEFIYWILMGSSESCINPNIFDQMDKNASRYLLIYSRYISENIDRKFEELFDYKFANLIEMQWFDVISTIIKIAPKQLIKCDDLFKHYNIKPYLDKNDMRNICMIFIKNKCFFDKNKNYAVKILSTKHNNQTFARKIITHITNEKKLLSVLTRYEVPILKTKYDVDFFNTTSIDVIKCLLTSKYYLTKVFNVIDPQTCGNILHVLLKTKKSVVHKLFSNINLPLHTLTHKDCNGNTALHIAILHHIDDVKYLLFQITQNNWTEKIAKLKNYNGMSAFETIQYFGKHNDDMINTLMKYNCINYAVNIVNYANNLDFAMLIINKFKFTALLALKVGNKYFFERLVDIMHDNLSPEWVNMLSEINFEKLFVNIPNKDLIFNVVEYMVLLYKYMQYDKWIIKLKTMIQYMVTHIDLSEISYVLFISGLWDHCAQGHQIFKMMRIQLHMSSKMCAYEMKKYKFLMKIIKCSKMELLLNDVLDIYIENNQLTPNHIGYACSYNSHYTKIILRKISTYGLNLQHDLYCPIRAMFNKKIWTYDIDLMNMLVEKYDPQHAYLESRYHERYILANILKEYDSTSEYAYVFDKLLKKTAPYINLNAQYIAKICQKYKSPTVIKILRFFDKKNIIRYINNEISSPINTIDTILHQTIIVNNKRSLGVYLTNTYGAKSELTIIKLIKQNDMNFAKKLLDAYDLSNLYHFLDICVQYKYEDERVLILHSYILNALKKDYVSHKLHYHPYFDQNIFYTYSKHFTKNSDLINAHIIKCLRIKKIKIKNQKMKIEK